MKALKMVLAAGLLGGLASTAQAADKVTWLNLVRTYNHGQGTTQNYTEAQKWYRKAVGQGHEDAQDILVRVFSPSPYPAAAVEATARLQKAAEQGDADAQNNLAEMYRHGYYHYHIDDVPQDDAEVEEEAPHCCFGRDYVFPRLTQNYAEAEKWYRKAAEQGHEKAQYLLGLMYEEGDGVTPDDAEAAKWFTKAAN